MTIKQMLGAHFEAHRNDVGRQALELWGGIECTIARIGDRFRDQVRETGHRDRLDDLDRVAALGIRTLRYPVLWESLAGPDPDWSWHDERLERLRVLGIRPIVTLCHHGSGPLETNLLDGSFADGLARHARRVAERYPWVELYTPVNEPLTTARFSALYGHWYPHARSYPEFLRALVNECRATVLAMRAIRQVRPDAGLVQTDDLGKTFSTPLLADQAEHDNQRRWLSFDLLCGMVDRDHPFRPFLTEAGITEEELALFAAADAAPDIIGINHYLTSDRYLDERLGRYPAHLHGGNGRQAYADVEAVRMPLPPGELGVAARLRETWQRYGRPTAITEVHHGCSRDEQLRWLMEVWRGAQAVRAEGADIRAVTIWSLFGTVDWNTLLTEFNDAYEPGTFDGRGLEPRPTVLAHAAKALATTGSFDHPTLDRPGWWKREDRFYRPRRKAEGCRELEDRRRLLINGATGTLGRAFSRIADHRGLDHQLLSRKDMDIADPGSVAKALACHKPWAVVNTAGFVRVADAERERDACFRENVEGAEVLARACADAGIPFVTFSSDLVFDGRLGRPYRESDGPNPTTAYGESKAEAERRVLAAHSCALVIRTSAFFGPWDAYNFVFAALRAASRGEPFTAGPDIVSPTYVPDLVHATLDLLVDGEVGLWHLANPGSTSWHELALDAVSRAGHDPGLIRRADEGADPRMNVLTSERGIVMPSLESALGRFFRDSEISWAEDPLRIAAE